MEGSECWEYLDAEEDLKLTTFLEKSLKEFNQEKWLESIIPQKIESSFVSLYDPNLSLGEIEKVELF